MIDFISLPLPGLVWSWSVCLVFSMSMKTRSPCPVCKSDNANVFNPLSRILSIRHSTILLPPLLNFYPSSSVYFLLHLHSVNTLLSYFSLFSVCSLSSSASCLQSISASFSSSIPLPASTFPLPSIPHPDSLPSLFLLYVFLLHLAFLLILFLSFRPSYSSQFSTSSLPILDIFNGMDLS